MTIAELKQTLEDRLTCLTSGRQDFECSIRREETKVILDLVNRLRVLDLPPDRRGTDRRDMAHPHNARAIAVSKDRRKGQRRNQYPTDEEMNRIGKQLREQEMDS